MRLFQINVSQIFHALLLVSIALLDHIKALQEHVLFAPPTAQLVHQVDVKNALKDTIKMQDLAFLVIKAVLSVLTDQFAKYVQLDMYLKLLK